MIGKQLMGRILHDTRAATAVEYGLLIGLMVLAMMVGMNGFSSEVNKLWNKVGTTLSTAA